MVDRTPEDRLDSWKEIAAYMRRDVKTVQRWEKREGMPVHRHLHDKAGSIYAFRAELDVWAANRRLTTPADAVEPSPGDAAYADSTPGARAIASDGRRKWYFIVAAVATILGLAVAASMLVRDREPLGPLENAKFLRLTDFNGVEHSAAISRDGRLVAFLSDRDGQMDVWVTQVGSGEFHNLTRGAAQGLVNPSVRALDFSPDGTLVTFWTRRADAA